METILKLKTVVPEKGNMSIIDEILLDSYKSFPMREGMTVRCFVAPLVRAKGFFDNEVAESRIDEKRSLLGHDPSDLNYFAYQEAGKRLWYSSNDEADYY